MSNHRTPALPHDWFGLDEAGLYASLIADWGCIHDGSYSCAHDIALMLGLDQRQTEMALKRLRECLGKWDFEDLSRRQ